MSILLTKRFIEQYALPYYRERCNVNSDSESKESDDAVLSFFEWDDELWSDWKELNYRLSCYIDDVDGYNIERFFMYFLKDARLEDYAIFVDMYQSSLKNVPSFEDIKEYCKHSHLFVGEYDNSFIQPTIIMKKYLDEYFDDYVYRRFLPELFVEIIDLAIVDILKQVPEPHYFNIFEYYGINTNLACA